MQNRARNEQLIVRVTPEERDHIYESVAVTLDCGGHKFIEKGKTVITAGWKIARDTNEEDESALPELAERQVFKAVTASLKEGKTTPPRRYTEDTLLSAMENANAEDMPEEAERKGLGTSATRSVIIEKLIKTGFMERQKKNLIPTALGINLISILPENIKSPLMTAEWEQKLMLGICGRYLEMQMKHEQSDDEHRFCRELFTAMYEDSVTPVNPQKLFYPYDFQKANERLEASIYHESRKTNTACICAIDDAIRDSCYKVNRYNLDIAAMKVILDYGFERVNMAFAKNIQSRDYDGRFSNSNKQWANKYEVMPKIFEGAVMNAHPILIDSFTTHTCNLYAELNAERFALPGKQPEIPDIIHGYEIVRSIEFDNDRGFAIGQNPNAANQYVCWQFTTENGARDYYWGNYADEFADATLNYTARIIVHMNGTDIKEVRRAVETEKITETPPELNEAEQNFAAWMEVTESSRYKWLEDEIYRLNGRGAMYYTGGEDGVYMRISNDGKLEAGSYEGAIPHIGEAIFTPVVTKQFDSFSESYTVAMEAGGKQFMTDMFSGVEHQPLVKMVGKDAAVEKQSVMDEIRAAQKTPKPPRKEKTPEQQQLKKKDETEL